MQRVVEVVVPLRVEAVAARVARRDEARVVQVALGHDPEGAAERGAEHLHALGQLLEEVDGRVVDDRVHGVEAKSIDMVIAEPHRRVVEEEGADLGTPRSVEVDGGTPRRRIAVDEVGPELAEVVPVRPEVVVDDVEHDGEAVRVASVDEPLQAVRLAVGVMRRPEVDAVVPPAAHTRELRDRHQLDGGDAEVDERRQLLDRRFEGSLRREGTDVQLVEDRRRERCAAPRPVSPPERRVVDEARGAVHAVGLPRRARIGSRRSAVERVGVVVARARAVDRDVEPAVGAGRHRVTDATHEHLDALGVRRPHAETAH